MGALLASSNVADTFNEVGMVPENTATETSPALLLLKSTGAMLLTVLIDTPVAVLLKASRSFWFGSGLALASTTLNTTCAWVVPTESFKYSSCGLVLTKSTFEGNGRSFTRARRFTERRIPTIGTWSTRSCGSEQMLMIGG